MIENARQYRYNYRMKYFVFSIDDGTIYDKKTIEVFNRFGIRATFNLNSGLQDFVWYNEGRPVERLKLWENREIYANHEVASHSLTHPHLTMCPDYLVEDEVKSDISNLSQIFEREIVTFAFPFEDFDDRCIDIIRWSTNVRCIRTSKLDESFSFPVDRYHINITTWQIDVALKLVDKFIKDDKAELFVFVAHSYDFEFGNSFSKLEELCKIVTSHDDIEIITMSELAKKIEERQ